MAKYNLNMLLMAIVGLAIVISGCTGGQDVTSVVKALPEVQQFMNEHPNAKITVTYWSKEEVTQSVQEISQQCDKPITPVAMYKATVSEGDLIIISWINAENQIAVCSITQGSGGSQIKTPTPIQTSTSTTAPTASIVASNYPDTSGPDMKIQHKGGDILKGGEWKLSIVPAGNRPNFITSSAGSDLMVGNTLIAATTTDGATYLTNSALNGNVNLLPGMKYDVKLIHIPSNAFLLDQIVEIRGSTEIIAPTPTAINTPQPTANAEIQIVDFSFFPSEVNIVKGETVIWKQKDYNEHSVAGSGFDSGELSQGQTFSHTFNEPGTYEYICKTHPSMRGKIIVKG